MASGSSLAAAAYNLGKAGVGFAGGRLASGKAFLWATFWPYLSSSRAWKNCLTRPLAGLRALPFEMVPELPHWNTNASAYSGVSPCCPPPPADTLHISLAQLGKEAVSEPSPLPNLHVISPLFSPHGTFCFLLWTFHICIVLQLSVDISHSPTYYHQMLYIPRKFNSTLHFTSWCCILQSCIFM